MVILMSWQAQEPLGYMISENFHSLYPSFQANLSDYLNTGHRYPSLVSKCSHFHGFAYNFFLPKQSSFSLLHSKFWLYLSKHTVDVI